MNTPLAFMVFRCGFCGRSAKEVEFLFQGECGNICDDCVGDALQKLKEARAAKASPGHIAETTT